ncbi:MAG TPA: hypothetical protein VN903_27805 [Polyangia bacterium]|jgi:hypothetical protein|nr:hypothetical protein [Polyangia bacterium]
MPDRKKEPPLASTRRQLRTIRKVLKQLKLEHRERYDAKDDISFFEISRATDDGLESAHLVHGPGLLAVYARFGVRAPKRESELLRFANIFNALNRQGCLFAEGDGTIVYRDSVCYSRVKDLEPGYVAGLIEGLIDIIKVVDLPLILIAKGKSAAEAVNELWVSATPARYVYAAT